MKEISLCLLQEEADLEHFLIESFHLSKNKIKNSDLSKKYLKKALRKGDTISLPINLINHLKINPDYKGEQIEILHQDRDLLVLNKPMNIHCHPLSYDEHDNALSFLRAKNFFSFLNLNQNNYDRGLLHRLDFETSGVLMLTSNIHLYDEVRMNPKLMKKKQYLALVRGKFDADGEWIHCLEASGTKGRKQKVVSNSDAVAKLSVQLKYFDPVLNVSLISVHLDTGLRHQIRVQMAELGFPLIGDTLYGGEEAQRLFLHSYAYQIEWNSKLLEFKAKHAPLFLDFLHQDSGLHVLGDELLVRKG
ncbi:MAG: RluA family pseudouridine synthase [Bdellovibrio sp.]